MRDVNVFYVLIYWIRLGIQLTFITSLKFRHRQQLVQQMQLIGTGNLGPHAANAIRYAAAQNGVWSLGNFGGPPPNTDFEDPQSTQSDSSDDQLIKNVKEHDYKHIFNSCSVGMVS